MKNTILLSFFVLLAFSSSAQKQKTISIKGSIDAVANCNIDTMRLFQWFAALPVEVSKTPLSKANGKMTYNFSLPANSKGFYYVGPSADKVKLFAINGEKEISISGTCIDMPKAVVSGSPTTDQLNEVITRESAIFNEFVGLIQRYSMNKDNADSIAVLDKLMRVNDQKKTVYLDSLKKANPFLAKVAAMNTYMSYQINKTSKEQTEPEYFGENYLKMIDESDPNNYQNPFYHDCWKNYAFNMARLGLDMERQREIMDKMLGKVKSGTNNHLTALFGLSIGSVNASDANFAYYGKKYLALYANKNAAMTNFIKDRIAQLGVIIGEEAPEIKEVTPEGDTVSLSSYRGKVVLVDFWASWCGPCRKANPHVVELYNKYKDKGFEVLGVSLDKDKNAWMGAIQKDGLMWRHVSDLAQWNSKWGRLYGVTSIPHAVIIDQKGRVVARQVSPGDIEGYLQRLLK